MDRFLIEVAGVDGSAERVGFDWLVAETGNRRLNGAVLLAGLDQISQLSGVLGRERAVAAKRDREVSFGGVKIKVFSLKTRPGHFPGPVLVPWADETMVGEAEGLGPAALCAISWEGSEFRAWTQAHNPVDPRTGEAIGESELRLDPVIEQALRIVMPKSIINRSDRRNVTQALKALYLCGEPFDSEEIRTWALAEGWAAGQAKALAGLATKILEDRPVRDSAMTGSQAREIVERLKAAAES